MNLKKISTLCFAATTLFAASTAMAWESEDGQNSTSASVALSTDYMWRGYSQTENEAAISGSFDYAHASGFYAGTWASNVDFNDDASAEIDAYFGFAGDIADSGFGYDVSFLRYMYDGETYDWNEYIASVSYSYFSAGIAYSNDVYGADEDAIYYSVGFDYDLPMDIALSAGVGYYDYASAYSSNNPLDFRLGLSKDFAGFGFDLTYTDSDDDAEQEYGDAASDGVLVFTISKSM